jgi:hypothetical protein
VPDRALRLEPQAVWITTNRAHALLFLGRIDEAKMLYLTHKGQAIPEQDNKLWEVVIGEDFAQFRKAGLSHPQKAGLSHPQLSIIESMLASR